MLKDMLFKMVIPSHFKWVLFDAYIHKQTNNIVLQNEFIEMLWALFIIKLIKWLYIGPYQEHFTRKLVQRYHLLILQLLHWCYKMYNHIIAFKNDSANIFESESQFVNICCYISMIISNHIALKYNVCMDLVQKTQQVDRFNIQNGINTTF